MLDWAVPVLLIVLACLLAAAWIRRDSAGRPPASLVIAAGAIAPLLIWSQIAASFARNLEASLTNAEPPAARPLGLLALLWSMIRMRLTGR